MLSETASGELPSGWTWRQIREFAREGDSRAGANSALPVLSVTKHRGLVLASTYFKKTVHGRDTANYKVVAPGEFAYATIHLNEGSIGLAGEGQRGLVSPMYTVFGVDGAIDRSYLFTALKARGSLALFDRMCQGTVNRRASVPFSSFASLYVATPPLAEQRKIAAILSSVDETIEKTEAVIAQLDVVKKAMLEELLTDGLPGLGTDHWRAGTVQDFGKVEGGRQLAPDAEGSARPYLRVANVFDGKIDTGDVKSMPLTDAEFGRFRLRVGDVLLNEGQSIELVGRAALYRGDPPVCAFQNSLIRFQSGPEAVPEFMEQLFRYWQRTGAFRSVAKQTTSIAHLGVSRFASMDLRLPPRGEQQRIADAVGSLDTRSASEARTRDALLATKMALAGALLSGSVRVHGESAA